VREKKNVSRASKRAKIKTMAKSNKKQRDLKAKQKKRTQLR
jgi:hypothetical protein